MFERILVVCVGNICRSPTAAGLLQHHLPSRAAGIGSAGLAALVNEPVDSLAGEIMAEHGIDAATHRARQLTREMLQESDLVLAMERRHLDQVRQIAPEATGKTFLLDKWIASRDIPDPYRQSRSVFEQVYAMIEQGVQAWLPYLQ